MIRETFVEGKGLKIDGSHDSTNDFGCFIWVKYLEGDYLNNASSYLTNYLIIILLVTQNSLLFHFLFYVNEINKVSVKIIKSWKFYNDSINSSALVILSY